MVPSGTTDDGALALEGDSTIDARSFTLAKGAKSHRSFMPCTLTAVAETAEMELCAGGGIGDVADEIKSSCARTNLLVHRGEHPEQPPGFAAARAARKGRSRWRWLIAGALCYAALAGLATV